MPRSQHFDEIFSVLYVDFDNIYTRLLEQDPALARTFATCPQRWLRWLEGHAVRIMYGDGVRRRILKRCCYLNPVRYYEFRPFFIRSAFQVVDCPPLTSHGKTSADIHLVMDCMDALAHTTRFDEFIILSGDADFTPLLLRIQEHARRSLVLSVGYTSPAYAAACSWRIREDWFVSQALEDPRDERSDSSRQPRRDDGHRRAQTDRERDDLSVKPESVANLALPAAKRIRLVEAVRELVDDSSVPVPLPSIAQMLQSEQDVTPDWFGAGTLRGLLEALDLSPAVFSPAGQGFVYDPERHDKPEDESLRDLFRQSHPELFEFALNINTLTDIPMLSPDQYMSLFALLADEVNGHGFSRSATVRVLSELAEDEDLPVSEEQIGTIIDAVTRGGLPLGGEGKINPASLRAAFAAGARDMCEVSQLTLNEAEQAMFELWLGKPEAA